MKKLASFDLTDVQRAERHHLLGVICSELPSKKDEAELYFIKTIALYSMLSKENYDSFTLELAQVYNDTGTFYHKQFQFEKAEEYYFKAIVIRETLVTKDARRYNTHLMESYINMSALYDDFCQYQNSLDYINRAMLLWEKYDDRNSEEFKYYYKRNCKCKNRKWNLIRQKSIQVKR